MQQASSSLARSIYRWTAFLALPGILWAAFEAYGLTLRGPQMLFFSIAHAMLPLLLAVYLSIPTAIAWLVQSAMALVHAGYRARLAMPRRPLAVFVAFIVAHFVALCGYSSWSGNAVLRVPLCVVGLILTGLMVREAWLWLRPARPSHQEAVGETDA